jgi:2'-5' RNA ligase
MRLFIAINFDLTVKARIRNAADQLREHAVRGRFVRDEHMHLTLEFLGEVEPNHILEICDAMDALDVEPFVMRTGDMDCFKRRDGDLWFLKIVGSQFLCGRHEEVFECLTGCVLQSAEQTVSSDILRNASGEGRLVDALYRTPEAGRLAKDEPLHQLQKALHRNLKKQGFRLETRPYRPHITIGRNVELHPDAEGGRVAPPDPCIEIDVQSIELMQSEFEGGRLVYTTLHSKPLT